MSDKNNLGTEISLIEAETPEISLTELIAENKFLKVGQRRLLEEVEKLKCQLAEAQNKQKQVDKLRNEIREWQEISAELADELEEQKKSEESGLKQIEQALDQTDNKLQKTQQVFSELKAQIVEINNTYLKK